MACFSDIIAETWWGVLAQARTLRPVIARMQAAVAAVSQEDRVPRPRLDGPNAMRGFLATQVETRGPVVREHRIIVQ